MIKLEKITYENYDRCIMLQVSEDQKSFVAPNNISLIHAYIALSEGDMIPMPYAIYNDDEIVGFIMLAFCKPDPKEADGKEAYCIWRFMIDEKHQRKGYGRQAISTALDLIRTFPYGQASNVTLYFEPENVNAEKLYKSFGFIQTGKIMDGEMELSLTL